MARERSAAPARMSGGPLALRVLAPLAVVAVHGRKPAAGKTSGKVRSYGFAGPHDRTLRVRLGTKASSDALSSGLTAAIVAALVGMIILLIVASGLLRMAVAAPLRGFIA